MCVCVCMWLCLSVNESGEPTSASRVWTSLRTSTPSSLSRLSCPCWAYSRPPLFLTGLRAFSEHEHRANPPPQIALARKSPNPQAPLPNPREVCVSTCVSTSRPSLTQASRWAMLMWFAYICVGMCLRVRACVLLATSRFPRNWAPSLQKLRRL